MYGYDKEMMEAFFKCQSPSEVVGDDFDEHILLSSLMTQDLNELIKYLPPEQTLLAERCYSTMHMYIELCSKFYFKEGWIAAKEDNKLDHY